VNPGSIPGRSIHNPPHGTDPERIMNLESINKELQQAYVTLKGLGFSFNDYRGTYHLHVPAAGRFLAEPHVYNGAVRYDVVCMAQQRMGRSDTLKGALVDLIRSLSCTSAQAARAKSAIETVHNMIDRLG
jgi:hypothetical protein